MLMAEIHNCLIVPKPGENLHVLTQRIDGYAIVPRPDYDALAARLARAERLLRKWVDGSNLDGWETGRAWEEVSAFLGTADSAPGANI